MNDLDLIREQLVALLPVGRDCAVKASTLAEELGTSTRVVGALIADLIENDQWLIGSTCSGDSPGYFICATPADVEAGCSHIVARAKGSFRRVAALKRAARERFAEHEVMRLFDLEDAS